MKRMNFVTIAALMALAVSAAQPELALADEPTYSEVFRFPPGDPTVKGISQLVRTDKGVHMTLMTTDLAPGAYTCWWVLNFGTPDMALGFATGHVVGPKGEATFAAHLREGEALSEFGSLEDARGQDVHVVVRYHGPVDPGRLYDQLHTFEPGIAANVQFSAHEAP